MTTVQAITQGAQSLSEETQREVLDFVEFLCSRAVPCGAVREAESTWSDFSLASAMRGMEDEPSPYTTADLKESFR